MSGALIWQRLLRAALVPLVTLGMLAFATAASASISPGVSSTSPMPIQAGASGPLDLDLTFAPTGTDTPKDLTLNLPPGLLTSAAIDNGGCLQTVDIQTSTCQIGSGVVTANLGGIAGNVPTPVGFYLVPPPAAGDLGGLAVATGGKQIGTTAPIVIRPSGDPAGVGATIELTLPNTLFGVSLQITQIDSTFTGLRYPTTCPAAPAQVTVVSDSYADPTQHSATLALPVTGCAALTYQPKYSVTAARDAGDQQVALVTQVTQSATESPSSSLSLAFPTSVLQPNLGSVGALCATVTSGTCSPVGSVTAASPLYPSPLTGKAYLTGSISDLNNLSLTLVFPSPFPLTLVGAVNLATLTTTFTGLPDIPLTDLQVSLNGGALGLFQTTCKTTSGTSTAVATDQNGDKTATDNAPINITGCPAGSGSGSGSGGSGSGSGSGGAPGGGSGATSASGLTVSAATVTGLKTGKPALSFTVAAKAKAPKLTSLTVTLPKGLRALRQKRTGKRVVAVTLKGAKAASATISKGTIVIKLAKPSAKVTVKLGPKALSESASLKAKAKLKGKSKQLRTVALTIAARTAGGKTARIPVAARVVR